MIQPATAEQRTDVETAVRNRSQYAATLYRLDPDANGPEQACVESEYREDTEFTDVRVAAYPHCGPCSNRSVSGVSGETTVLIL